MVKVHLWAGLHTFSGGVAQVNVEAQTVGEVLSALASTYPAMAEILENSVSVAVDGHIVTNSLTVPVLPNSEVVVIQRIKGG